MQLHVYGIKGKMFHTLSSKPIRSRQVALYANQVLICNSFQAKKFSHENEGTKH